MWCVICNVWWLAICNVWWCVNKEKIRDNLSTFNSPTQPKVSSWSLITLHDSKSSIILRYDPECLTSFIWFCSPKQYVFSYFLGELDWESFLLENRIGGAVNAFYTSADSNNICSTKKMHLGIICKHQSDIGFASVLAFSFWQIWFVGKPEICRYSRRESWRALVIQLPGGKFEGWLEGGNPVGHRVMLIRRPH